MKINIPTHIGAALRQVLASLQPLAPDERRRVLRATALLVSTRDDAEPPAFTMTFDGPRVRSAAAVRASDRRKRQRKQRRKVQRCTVCEKPGHNARAHRVAPSLKLEARP